jgi:hypothetical protein
MIFPHGMRTRLRDRTNVSAARSMPVSGATKYTQTAIQ